MPIRSETHPTASETTLAFCKGKTITGNNSENIKRQHILEVTCSLLEAHGYRDISMDNIAKKAGMSKKTLYLFFPSKHTLLEQLILEKLFGPLEVYPDEDEKDLETSLFHFISELGNKLLNEKRLGLLRAIIGETTRSASVQKLMNELFHLASPKLGLQNWLALQKEKGTLNIGSPKDAADYLFGLTLCVPLLGQLAHCGPMREKADFARFIKDGVRIFLAAYQTKSSKHSS